MRAADAVLAYLETQTGFVHISGIAKGAGVSRPTVRRVLMRLDAEHRVEVRSPMPGPVGPGYRLVRPGRAAGAGAADAEERAAAEARWSAIEGADD